MNYLYHVKWVSSSKILQSTKLRLRKVKYAISIPVLSDEQSTSFRKLGILNEDDRPADSEYELPHSGMITINRENVVVGKLFVEIPTLRVDSGKGHAEASNICMITSN